MNALEWTFSGLAAAASAVSIAVLLKRRAWRPDFDERMRDDYVGDIRAMNTYNSYFMAAIVVFFGFVFGGTSGGANNDLPHSALTMLTLAFLTGASAMFYVPVRHLRSGRRPSDRRSIEGIHARWLAAILCSQLTVIFSVSGVLTIVASHFASDRAHREMTAPATPAAASDPAKTPPG